VLDHPSARSLAAFERSLAKVSLTTERALWPDDLDVTDPTALDAWRRANAWRLVRTTNGGGGVRGAWRARRGTLPAQELVVVRTPSGPPYIAASTNGDTLLFATDHMFVHPGDFWTDIRTTTLASEGGVTFRNGKKPLSLIRRIVGAHPNPDALVLDFFAGSGTTAEAVAMLNAADGGRRRAILVTSDEGGICYERTLPRIRNVIDGYAQQPPRPAALRCMRVSSVAATDPASRAAAQSTSAALAALDTDSWDATPAPGYTLLSGPARVAVVTDPTAQRDALAALRAKDVGTASRPRIAYVAAPHSTSRIEHRQLLTVAPIPLDDQSHQ
jgi:hypothetical protein